jgi:hypothetical protein
MKRILLIPLAFLYVLFLNLFLLLLDLVRAKKLRQRIMRYHRVRCDYCKQKVDVWYEAYLFPVPEYKGIAICKPCIDKLPDQKNIIWVNEKDAPKVMADEIKKIIEK